MRCRLQKPKKEGLFVSDESIMCEIGTMVRAAPAPNPGP
jgi:hypothetical protein